MAISVADKNFLVSLYVGYFNRAPDPAGLQYWIEQVEAGRDTNTIAADFAASTEAKALYPFLTTPDVSSPTTFITSVYQNLFNRAPDAAGQAFWEGQLSSGAVSAADMIDAIIKGATTAPDSTIIANKNEAGLDFANDAGNTAGFVYNTDAAAAASNAISGVTEDAATVAAAKSTTDAFFAGGGGTDTTTTTLTTSVDNVVGGTGSDLINAAYKVIDAGADVATLGALDVIDGGAGVDTLKVANQEATGVTLPAATISNVEIIDVQSGGGAVSIDTRPTTITGVETIKAQATAGGVIINTNADVTKVEVSGTATGATIIDNGAAGKDTLATVSATGHTGALAVTSDALTSVSIANTTQNATVTAAAGTRDLTVTLDNVTGGTITDATATGLNITTSGTASTGVSVVAGAATAITVDAAKDLTTVGVTAGAAKTIDVNGAGKVNLGNITGLAALTSVNSTDSTGGLTATIGNAVDFTGGAGKDAISAGATTKALNLGAGDDTYSTTIAAGAGGSIDGGEGTDTVALSSANAATLSATTAFEADISNFEQIQIGITGAADTVNLANLDDISYVKSAGTAGGANVLTLTNMANDGTLELNGPGAGSTVVTMKDATGAADSLNVVLTNSTAGVLGFGSVSAAGVETLKISTNDTGTNANTAATIDTATLVAVDATSVSVSGNNGLTLTNTGNTKIKTFDASGVKADATDDTSANLAVTFVSDNVTDAVTLTGGEGNDTLTADAASTKANTISGNKGNDILTGGAGADVLNGGEGDDVLDGMAGVDVLTGGDGKDTFVATTVSTSGVAHDTIADLAAGDKILFGSALTNADADATAAGSQLGGALSGIDPNVAVFQDYLDAAANKGADMVSWFQFSGNTYVVQDEVGGTSTFVNGTDNVVKIAGLVDLSDATFAGATLTIV